MLIFNNNNNQPNVAVICVREFIFQRSSKIISANLLTLVFDILGLDHLGVLRKFDIKRMIFCNSVHVLSRFFTKQMAGLSCLVTSASECIDVHLHFDTDLNAKSILYHHVSQSLRLL